MFRFGNTTSITSLQYDSFCLSFRRLQDPRTGSVKVSTVFPRSDLRRDWGGLVKGRELWMESTIFLENLRKTQSSSHWCVRKGISKRGGILYSTSLRLILWNINIWTGETPRILWNLFNGLSRITVGSFRSFLKISNTDFKDSTTFHSTDTFQCVTRTLSILSRSNDQQPNYDLRKSFIN